MALMETVFVRDYPEEKLAGEYEVLATSVMAQVSDDPHRLAAEAVGELWNEKKDMAGAITRALRVASHLPDLGVAMLRPIEEVGQESDGKSAPEMTQLHAVLSQNADTRLAALNNWGNALYADAKTKAGEEADRLFEEAGRKYAEALHLKPDFPEALFNWGNALSDQAKTKTGEEADRLFEEAGRKYAEALRLEPDYLEALGNWGNALYDQAKTKAGEEADRLFKEAGRKLAEHAGSNTYNLACAEAIEGNTREAIRWLQACESAGERLSRARIAAEKDFDRIRNQPEFVSFVESLDEN
jgi:tetratricopeptide (TPR) repeat protein